MRGALEEEEEEEDEGVLGSVLLHSPLLVEGISANGSNTVRAARSRFWTQGNLKVFRMSGVSLALLLALDT